MTDVNIKGKKSSLKLLVGSAVLIIVVVVALLLVMQGQNQTITANTFFDDLIDRDGDGVIKLEDRPFDWESYDIGDNITVRDKISRVYSYTGELTVIVIEYSGEYEFRDDFLFGRIDIVLEGNWTSSYQVGDYITAEATIISYPSGTGEFVSAWKVVSS